MSSADADKTDRAFLGGGWAFPVAIAAANDVMLAEYEEDVRQAILIILQTEPGERVMRPDFGTGLRALVFEPINTTTIALAKHRVEQALVQWEPRIDQVEVTVTVDPPQGRLTITVQYRVRLTNTFYNLVYPFFVEEGVERRGGGAS
jgi:phage baseplate assembly protein W